MNTQEVTKGKLLIFGVFEDQRDRKGFLIVTVSLFGVVSVSESPSTAIPCLSVNDSRMDQVHSSVCS